MGGVSPFLSSLALFPYSLSLLSVFPYSLPFLSSLTLFPCSVPLPSAFKFPCSVPLLSFPFSLSPVPSRREGMPALKLVGAGPRRSKLSVGEIVKLYAGVMPAVFPETSE